MKCISIIFFFSLSAQFGISQILPPPHHLRCDLLLNTDKVIRSGVQANVSLTEAINKSHEYQYASICNQEPFFYWQVDTLIKSISAYRILVASSLKALKDNKADMWDSKKIMSNLCKAKYDGKTLKTGKVYFWKLQVWNDKNISSEFSSIHSFVYQPADSFNNIVHYPLVAENQKPLSIIKKANGDYFLDFGKDGFAQLHLHLTSDQTDSISIEAGETLENASAILKSNGNIRYIKQGILIKKGTHDYTIIWPENEKRNKRNPILMPDYIGEVFPFRYVSIENFHGVLNKNSVGRKLIHYPFDDNASGFISNDTVLNKVLELCKYSVKATSFTGYYVDGDRERLPYEADALINQLSHYAVDAEYSMARRSINYVLYHPTWPTEWSLQNIMLAWNDYLYTGDISFIQKYYPELQKKILMSLESGNGLISTRTNKQTESFLQSIYMLKDFDGKHGLKDNVDWPQKGSYIGNEKQYGGETDGFVYQTYNSVINAFYYHDLLLMYQMAKLLNKNDDAILYETKAKQVYHSFQKIFRDEKSGLIKDGDSTDHSSLHANMFALEFGLVEKTDKEKVIEFIKSRKMACSVYGAQFLLEALFDNNEDAYAIDLLSSTKQRSWYNMIRTGSTITMEAWDKLYKPNLDLNHAWGTAPANIIVRKLFGIEPLSPGGDTIQIKPQMGNLSLAHLSTTLIKGKISISYKKNTKHELYDIIIPGAVVANMYLKKDNHFNRLLIDGKVTNMKSTDDRFIEIKNIKSGKHLIVMQ